MIGMKSFKKNIFFSDEAINFFWVVAILVGRSERGNKRYFIKRDTLPHRESASSLAIQHKFRLYCLLQYILTLYAISVLPIYMRAD
jgi:hypothetical protein